MAEKKSLVDPVYVCGSCNSNRQFYVIEFSILIEGGGKIEKKIVYSILLFSKIDYVCVCMCGLLSSVDFTIS